jgi:hypothetical protein
MAATVKTRTVPSLDLRLADITLDASYPANGYALKASDFGLSSIEAIIAPHTAGYDFEWDAPSSKLKAYRVGSGFSLPLAEVGATTSLASVTLRAIVIGY